jgi:hypothetical protein
MASPFIADGQLSWSGGVNSIKPTTIQGPNNPDGLPRNCLSWLNNGSTRDGGISPRGAYNYLGTFHDASGLYQGQILYQPIDDSAPYFLIAVSGHILQVYPDSPGSVADLSVKFNLFHPATEPYFFFVQGEQFVVIQAGDLVTKPLFWDGATLRRSNGIITVQVHPTSFALIGTGFFTVPGVGNSVVINLSAAYPGPLGDTVEMLAESFVNNLQAGLVSPPSDMGAFLVTAKTAVAPFTVTLQCVDTTTPGNRGAPGNITFLVKAGAPFMGRIWYAQGNRYCAGDIVGGPAGSSQYAFTDSILKITENPLALGGDGFSIPTSAGNIRSIKHTASIDSSFGQGQLIIGTRKSIYQLNVPISRTNWIASDSNNQPQQTVVQINNGTVGDRSVVNVNGDIFYMSLEPSIRSLIMAVRYFGQWGNRSISSNEQRVLQFTDRSLLRFASGIDFDNRLYMTLLPQQTAQGVIHKAIAPLDFVPSNTFEENTEPVWGGVNEGLDMFQLARGDFNGLERAFATARLQDGSFSIWEITTVGRFDNNFIGEARIDWSMEFPAYTWQKEFLLKRMVSAELWVDRLFGEVVFKLEYRPDGETCWKPWHTWKVCAARNTAEDCVNPIAYPLQPYGDGYKQTMVLPKPPITCESFTGRPSDVAYQQQCRLTVHGYCRIRGFLIYAEPVEKEMFKGIVC